MAQAYEYEVIQNSNVGTFVAALATEDAAGWEVIGYTAVAGNPVVHSAILRRRV